MPTALAEVAPAKINLTLTITGRRTDGFHDLDSLVAFACDVGDRLTLDLEAPAAVSACGLFAEGIVGENLAARALALLAVAEPGLRLGHIAIDKQLPVAAGVGGGSADAAAALRLIRGANPDLDSRIDWAGIAAQLGSDVPVCLSGVPTRMTGTGDRLDRVQLPGPLAAVLVNPLVPVPADKTRRVFAELGLAPGARDPSGRPSLRLDRCRDMDALIGELRRVGNDLAAPATRVIPAIAEALAELGRAEGLRHAAVSGAGPTCFGLFAGMDAAEHAARQLAARRPAWWVRASAIDG